jgi:hypothetical protein
LEIKLKQKLDIENPADRSKQAKNSEEEVRSYEK